MNVKEAMQSALKNYQAGNVREAEDVCKKILEIQADNVHAIHVLSMIYYQLKDYDSAIKYTKKLINLTPNNAQAYYILGHSLQARGQIDQAIVYYQKSLQLNPNFADAYYNLGTIFQDKKQYGDAISCYHKTLLFNPGDIDAYYNLGRVLQEQKEFDKAIACYQKALHFNPNLADAYNNIGTILHEKEQLDEAIIYFKKALELKPHLPGAYNNIGIILQKKEQFDEALSYFRQALKLSPEFYEAYHNMGIILQGKEQYDEAMTCFQKALRFEPNDVEVLMGLGSALCGKEQYDEAITCFQKVLQLDSHNADAHFCMSSLLLLFGDFKQGWKEYEWRWESKDFRKTLRYRKPSDFSQPLWDGSSLEGKSILLFAEQGVGDEIMFASCFQEIIMRAGKCFVECDKRLIPIFARSFPKAILIERFKEADAYSSQLPQTYVVAPIASLPKFLRTDFSTFPQKSYLVPDADKVHSWRNRFKELGEGLKVGISWLGGGIPAIRRKRSIMLEKFEKLFSLSGVQFINLQYGDCKHELEVVKENLGITIYDWEDADPLKDLDDFAAQIFALDLVISVDNATVHMAGALGGSVWTLIPFIPEWRWMLHREDSPWYPTMRLFRQLSPGDWKTVIDKVQGELIKLSGKH